MEIFLWKPIDLYYYNVYVLENKSPILEKGVPIEIFLDLDTFLEFYSSLIFLVTNLFFEVSRLPIKTPLDLDLVWIIGESFCLDPLNEFFLERY